MDAFDRHQAPDLDLSRHELALEVAGRVGHLSLYGRAAMLRQLTARFDDAMAGRTQVILLSGEAGIGKSRLLAELFERAEAAGWRTATGTCLDEEGMPAYFPWVAVLRALERDAKPSDALTLITGTSGETRGALFTSAHSRFRLFDAVARQLELESNREPLAIAIDDLQWADTSTVHLLRVLATQLTGHRVAIVGAYRSDGASSAPELQQTVAELERRRVVTRFEVESIGVSDTRELLNELVGFDSEQLARVIHRRSDGNPFVIEELVRALVDQGMISSTSAQIDLEQLPLPSSVSASIVQRIQGFSSEDRDLLELAAVAGKEIAPLLLAGAWSRPLRSVEAALERLRQAGLIEEAAFAHDRVREAILAQLAPDRRRMLHGRLAAVLQTWSADSRDLHLLADLAFHADRAGEAELAMRTLVRLGDASLAAHGPDEAVAAYRQAISLLAGGENSELASLNLRLGEAKLQAGSVDAAGCFLQALDFFERTGDQEGVAKASLHCGRAYAHAEQHERAVAAFERARDALADRPDCALDLAATLICLSDVLGLSLGRTSEAIAAGEQALALIRLQHAGDGIEAQARLSLGHTLLRANRFDEARRVLEPAIGQALRARELPLGAELHGALANLARWSGDLFASELHGSRRLQLAASTGDRFAGRHGHAWLALVATSRGEWAQAVTHLETARAEAALVESPEPAAFVLQVAGWNEYLQGDYLAAAAHFSEALAGFREIGPPTLVWYLGCLALTLERLGERAEALALVAETWNAIEGLPRNALHRAPAGSTIGLVVAEHGDLEMATRLYRMLEPFHGQLHWFLVDRTRAALATRLGDPAQAKRHLQAAVQTARGGGIWTEQAIVEAELCVIDYAESTSTNRTKCRQRLEEAIDHLQIMGMAGEAARFAERAGQLSSNFEGRRPAGLSAREAEVLVLVAEGLTNREIGLRMSISEKTVAAHLASAFTKADLENRAAAAVFAIRNNLGT